ARAQASARPVATIRRDPPPAAPPEGARQSATLRRMRILCRALTSTLCAALELGGCGRPPAPVPPAPLVVRTEHYAPLGMATDAKLPGQAVILGTDESNGSTVLPLATTPRTAVVDAMVVTPGGSGPASGRMIAVALTTAPAVAMAPDAAASPNTAATGDTL